ncbi:MAG: MBL fold metallo-hydrolase [Candidatus Gastranaerophilales bacterium]|nr:MBL fold metallo-hydrolase [Candidatus Gastranaerophilales bacterium]
MEEKIMLPIHSSICIKTDKTIYIDPYRSEGDSHDADIIYITHEHYDHFSPEDIEKVRKEDTVYVLPESMRKAAQDLRAKEGNVVLVKAGEKTEIAGVPTETVAAYNHVKPFHPKNKGWVGYILTIEGERIYIAGDTDSNEENRQVKCDIAIVPVGGFYTMDAKKAAELVNSIKPKIAIPSHYGSAVGKAEDGDTFCKYVDSDIKVIKKIKL